MSSKKSKSRKLRVESLEKRMMLDGALAVSVVNGLLIVTGDSSSNGVTISPSALPAVGGTAGNSFIIQPDATTTVNNGKVGASLVVGGVTAGATIDLGDGADSLWLKGGSRAMLGDVSVSTGSGSGKVSISDFHFNSLAVTDTGGSVALDVSRCVVDGAVVLDAEQGHGDATFTNDSLGLPASSGAPLTLVSLSSTNFGLRLHGTRTGASVVGLLDQTGGVIQIADKSSIGGGLSVVSQGSCDFSMTQSTCALDAYLKFDASAAKSPPSVVVQGSTLRGALVVSSQGATDFEFHKSRFASVTLELDNASTSSRSTVNETDVDCGGAISVSSAGAQSSAVASSATGALDFSASSVRASDIFLKLDGLQGASVVDKTSLDHITLTGGLVVSSTATQALSAKYLKFDYLKVSLDDTAQSRSSVVLGSVNAGGQLDVSSTSAADVSVSSARASDIFLKYGDIKVSDAADKTNLDHLTLTGGLVVSSTATQALSARNIKLDYLKVSLDDTAQGRSSVAIGDLNGDGLLDISSTSAADVSASSVRASDIFIKYGDIKATDAADKTSLDHLTLTGGLVVSSTATQALSAKYLKFDYLKVSLDDTAQARSSVVLGSVNAGGELDVSSTSAADVSVSSARARDIYLKLDGIPGTSAVDKTTLNQLTLAGGLYVSGTAAQSISAQSLRLNFTKIEIKAVDDQPSSLAIGGLTSGGELDISATSPLSVSASAVKASDFFLALEDTPGLSVASSANLQNITLLGALDASSKDAAKMTIGSLRCDSAYLKLDNSSTTGRSSLSLAGVTSRGAVDIVCSGACDVSAGGALGTSRASDLYMKLDSIAGQAGPSSVSLTNWSLDGTLDVASQGALNFSIGQLTAANGAVTPAGGLRATDVSIQISDAASGSPGSTGAASYDPSKVTLNDLALLGSLDVETGSGDDTLIISKARVQGMVYLFGGAGNDHLVVRTSSFKVTPIEISWETTELK